MGDQPISTKDSAQIVSQSGATLSSTQGTTPQTVSPDQIALVRQVANVVETGAFKPPMLPEVAINLTRLARQENVRLAKIENAVTQDPAIAARILSVARSALYSRGAAVKSMRVAIMRIGLKEVRDIAYQFAAKTRIFQVPGYSERVKVLFESSQACGFVARELCRILRLESDLAYLCGLLHDIGEAILLGIIVDIKNRRKEALPPVEEIRPIIDQYGSTVGARVCQKWNLPDTISDAIAFHHTPEKSTDSSKMAAVIAAANLAIAHVGLITSPSPIERIDIENHSVFRMLDMSSQHVDALFAYTEMLGETPEAWKIA